MTREGEIRMLRSSIGHERCGKGGIGDVCDKQPNTIFNYDGRRERTRWVEITDRGHVVGSSGVEEPLGGAG